MLSYFVSLTRFPYSFRTIDNISQTSALATTRSSNQLILQADNIQLLAESDGVLLDPARPALLFASYFQALLFMYMIRDVAWK